MRRWLVRLLAACLALPLAYLLAGLAGALIPGAAASLPDSGGIQRIGLIRGPIHYDFLLPLDAATRQAFAFAAADPGLPVMDPGATWLLAGWGSRAFYTTTGRYSDVSAATAWQAATGDSAVMHLAVWGNPPADLPGLTWLDMTPAAFAALRDGILDSFARDAAGAPMPLPLPGFGPSDAFWAGTGDFSLLYTCNVWLGERLRAAGLPFGLWTPLPQSVDLALSWNALAAPAR